ncbi:GNAT family N-acetyltransferase [Corynebacterium pacaense]|uniref:GNAT family N-acetyltransferase n=1 Tax=Corynebacterium pacaense TaxID=1816684 RepID=UPI0009BB0CC9|nr:GNAT family N-acetyltransferase [Corynebacterium pacaense]
MTTQIDQLVHSRLDSIDALPLVEELAREYAGRYEGYTGFNKPANYPDESKIYPPLLFEPPYGDFLLIRRGFDTVAGGAFMFHDEETAEIKRIWTSSGHRRQGLSRTIMGALEREIAERGYSRIFLTTGPRQPEARHLYLSLGYTPLFNLDADFEKIGKLPFEKEITPSREGVDLSGLRARWRGLRQRQTINRTFRWRDRPGLRLENLTPQQRTAADRAAQETLGRLSHQH